ncbi:MAG: hypothetical protein LC808_37700 [Actinobacteria bacterium]|nr:hypothetical protein [Actinomycetota bacterium]
MNKLVLTVVVVLLSAACEQAAPEVATEPSESSPSAAPDFTGRIVVRAQEQHR